MSELTSTEGIVALVAGGIGVLALALGLYSTARVRRLRRDQLAIIGEGPPRELLGYVHELQHDVEAIGHHLEEATGDLAGRAAALEHRLAGAITHAAVVRYDAYNEMSGRQSSSIALLDDRLNGVVISSILHREQARLYAKPLQGGESEIGLSPEEQEAVERALSGDSTGSAGRRTPPIARALRHRGSGGEAPG